MHTIARNAIVDSISEVRKSSSSENGLPESLTHQQGAFVSIYVKDELRGCIGRISSEDPLNITIKEMAVAAALKDNRFSPVKKNELEDMKIEISVLSPLKAISSPDEIIPEKHGILIKKDFRSGTFLPQVARRTGWDAEQLLSECAERKAGIGRDGWKDAELYTYEAFVFSDKDA